MKLQEMTDFVLDQEKTDDPTYLCFARCIKYADFLKQLLTLGMFVPVDEEGNVFEKVEKPLSPATDEEWGRWTEYQQAKERVLFEGFEHMHGKLVKSDKYFLTVKDKQVEHLLRIDEEILLTPTAIKQIGL